MSDTPVAPTDANGVQATAEQPNPQPTEPDWKAEARKWEARSKQNSDAAARLAEIEEANKSAEQKLVEKLTALETKVADYETRDQIAAWKAEVAKETGVPIDALAGATREAIAAHAEILKPLITPAPPAPPKADPVPALGSVPESHNMPLDAQIAAADAAGDKALVGVLKAMKLAKPGQ